MSFATEQFRPVPFAIGILAALAIILGLDFRGRSVVDPSEARKVVAETSAAWVNENGNKLLQATQAALFGTGVWVASLEPKDFALVGEAGDDANPTMKTALFDLKNDKVRGRLEVVVDLRTNTSFGVGAHVTAVYLRGLEPLGSPSLNKVERIYSSSRFARGMVRYYLDAAASIAWHLVLAGLLYGVIRLLPIPTMFSVGLCFLLAAVVVNYASGRDASWFAGTLSLAALAAAWGASELIRRKRHLEVLRLIIPDD